jgi:hypothetical protein
MWLVCGPLVFGGCHTLHVCLFLSAAGYPCICSVGLYLPVAVFETAALVV